MGWFGDNKLEPMNPDPAIHKACMAKALDVAKELVASGTTTPSKAAHDAIKQAAVDGGLSCNVAHGHVKDVIGKAKTGYTP